MAGLIVSLVINFWQAIGSLLNTRPPPPTFPLGLQCATFLDPNATLTAPNAGPTDFNETLFMTGADLMNMTTPRAAPMVTPEPIP